MPHSTPGSALRDNAPKATRISEQLQLRLSRGPWLGRSWLAVALLLIASCASMPSTKTGFLSVDYTALKRAPEFQTWGIPDKIFAMESPALKDRIRNGSIKDVYVAPVVYQPIPNARYQPSQASGERIEGYATRKLKNALAKHFNVVNEPVPGSVEIRLAMTDMMCANVWFNTIMIILAVPLDMGGVSGEMEFVDTDTGEPLMAMTLTREGTPFIFFETINTHGHIRHGLKKWAILVSDVLRGERALRPTE